MGVELEMPLLYTLPKINSPFELGDLDRLMSAIE